MTRSFVVENGGQDPVKFSDAVGTRLFNTSPDFASVTMIEGDVTILRLLINGWWYDQNQFVSLDFEVHDAEEDILGFELITTMGVDRAVSYLLLQILAAQGKLDTWPSLLNGNSDKSRAAHMLHTLQAERITDMEDLSTQLGDRLQVIKRQKLPVPDNGNSKTNVVEWFHEHITHYLDDGNDSDLVMITVCPKTDSDHLSSLATKKLLLLALQSEHIDIPSNCWIIINPQKSELRKAIDTPEPIIATWTKFDEEVNRLFMFLQILIISGHVQFDRYDINDPDSLSSNEFDNYLEEYSSVDQESVKFIELLLEEIHTMIASLNKKQIAWLVSLQEKHSTLTE